MIQTLGSLEQLAQFPSAHLRQVPLVESEKPKLVLQFLKHCPSFKEYPCWQTLHSKNILWKASVPHVKQLFGQLTHKPWWAKVVYGHAKDKIKNITVNTRVCEFFVEELACVLAETSVRVLLSVIGT